MMNGIDPIALAAVLRGWDSLSVSEEKLRANEVPTLGVVGANDPLKVKVDDLDWQTGVAGMALSFDGVNDYLEVPDSDALDFGANSFTVSFWFYKLATAINFTNSYGVNKWKSGNVGNVLCVLVNQYIPYPALCQCDF